MSIPNIDLRELVNAGVHFGHKSQRWNPKMQKYIHSTRENVHIINLNHTVQMMHFAWWENFVCCDKKTGISKDC